jgi:hypothetical protein
MYTHLHIFGELTLLLTRHVTKRILNAFDKRICEEKDATKVEEETRNEGNDTSETRKEDNDISEEVFVRRHGVRKDGRTRTHKKQAPMTLGPAPTTETGARRKFYAWYLWNY